MAAASQTSPHDATVALGGRIERLWCLIVHHAPDSSVRWHQGYGFAHCRRCKQPIVRSLLSNWMVPGPGLRIVWDTASARPAAPAGVSQPTVEVARARATPKADSVTPRAVAKPDVTMPLVTARPPATASIPDQAGGEPHSPLDEANGAVARIVSLPGVPEADAAPIDLLGPNFMGHKGAPPGPSEGLSVFEFDDMTADDGAGTGPGIAAQSGR